METELGEGKQAKSGYNSGQPKGGGEGIVAFGALAACEIGAQGLLIPRRPSKAL